MIKYALRCAKAHDFEGWFRNSAAFDAQAAAGDLACPQCGSRKVGKAIMAPRLAKASGGTDATDTVSLAAPKPAQAELRTKLLELRRAVEATCEDVGPDFAEEARKIHYGEAEARGIYGQASREEAEALTDEGVAFSPLPWVARGDA